MTPSDTAHPEGERELLPCPFCGAAAEIIDRAGRRAVRCADLYCGGMRRAALPGEDGVAAWNTRSTPPSRPQGEEGLTPDDLTENELRGSASALLREKGWKPGDHIHIHGMIELLVAFGLKHNLEKARCGYPDCGCDFDAVCEAALSNQGKPSS